MHAFVLHLHSTCLHLHSCMVTCIHAHALTLATQLHFAYTASTSSLFQLIIVTNCIQQKLNCPCGLNSNLWFKNVKITWLFPPFMSYYAFIGTVQGCLHMRWYIMQSCINHALMRHAMVLVQDDHVQFKC